MYTLPSLALVLWVSIPPRQQHPDWVTVVNPAPGLSGHLSQRAQVVLAGDPSISCYALLPPPTATLDFISESELADLLKVTRKTPLSYET